MFEVIKTYPLATIISIKDNEPLITHLPLIYNEFGKLIGHIDKQNPQAAAASSVPANGSGSELFARAIEHHNRGELSTAADLYVLLWNRAPESSVAMSGNTDLMDLWRGNFRVRWG